MTIELLQCTNTTIRIIEKITKDKEEMQKHQPLTPMQKLERDRLNRAKFNNNILMG